MLPLGPITSNHETAATLPRTRVGRSRASDSGLPGNGAELRVPDPQDAEEHHHQLEEASHPRQDAGGRREAAADLADNRSVPQLKPL